MRWEYNILCDGSGLREENFNKLGKQGWELVCLDTETSEYIFKRLKK